MDYLKLVENLIERGYLKTPLIIEAFKHIDRADFVPANLKNETGVNAPLPIGFEQTNSQPLTVAFMLELLQPQWGDKILDIGSGSGWTSALLAHCVSGFVIMSGAKDLKDSSVVLLPQNDKLRGRIFAIERIPELCEFGKNNILKYNFIKKGIVELICADGSQGLAAEALFDRILVSAAADEIPPALKEQLTIGGRLVIPIKNSIWLVERQSKDEFKEQEFYGFSFVPLINKQ